MIKMYRRDAQAALNYVEIWVEQDLAKVARQHGKVGYLGELTGETFTSVAQAQDLLEAMALEARGNGYADLPEEEQFWVVAQYALKTVSGTERDQYLQAKAERVIENYFSWRGLGVVDRSEFVPGKLNIFCLVPDAAKAVAGLKVCLREARLDFTKLSIGVARFGDLEAIKLKHSHKAARDFALA